MGILKPPWPGSAIEFPKGKMRVFGNWDVLVSLVYFLSLQHNLEQGKNGRVMNGWIDGWDRGYHVVF